MVDLLSGHSQPLFWLGEVVAASGYLRVKEGTQGLLRLIRRIFAEEFSQIEGGCRGVSGFNGEGGERA